ncbi:MAG TPA: 16S rRNA (guanine(527)-N(7))-methyltransferase RsmG [Planctomycetota bacterium]|nr:16S rRNA (guanine(527)-N(7))-methyltransferase RsmG [Planctomycetota bacterium]
MQTHDPGPEPSREALAAAIAEILPGKDAAAVAKLAEHAHRVLLANRTLNLTRITEPREVAVKHVFDSLLVPARVDLAGARVLDVGTGAGWPGIPIAVEVPSAHVTLLDGTAKKIAVVEDAIAALELCNAVAVHGRAETHLVHTRYDVLVARAVGPISRLLPWLLPRRGQFAALVAMKGPAGIEEWEEAEASGAARGFELAEVHQEELPAGAGRRVLLVIAPTGRRRLSGSKKRH